MEFERKNITLEGLGLGLKANPFLVISIAFSMSESGEDFNILNFKSGKKILEGIENEEIRGISMNRYYGYYVHLIIDPKNSLNLDNKLRNINEFRGKYLKFNNVLYFIPLK